VHRSMVKIEFRTPSTVLLLMVGGGGGGPECWLNMALRSMVQRQAHQWTDDDIFWTPPTGLLLTMGGGGGLEWSDFLAGPSSLHGRNPLVQTPTTYHFLTYPHHPMTSFSTFP
jgi:hypothetical protein